MIKGIDYSWGRPGGAAIKAAGQQFVVRYIPYPGHGGKGLETAELADLRASGLAVCLVYESTAARVLDGYYAGVTDARLAKSIMANMGFPASQACYFAVDFDTNTSHEDEIRDYFLGVLSDLPVERVGVYGEYSVCVQAQRELLATYFWQCRAWSGTPIQYFPDRHIFQNYPGGTINGVAVDYNDAMQDDYGQWPAEQTGEEDMTDDDLLAIFSGKEDALAYTREERLVRARFRRDEAAAGRAPSVREMAASASFETRSHSEMDHNPGAVFDHTHHSAVHVGSVIN